MYSRYRALRCLAVLALSPVWSCSSKDGGAGRETSPDASRAGAGGDAASGSGGVTATGGSPAPSAGGVPFPAVTLPGGLAGMGGQGGKPDVMNGECAQFNFESARKPAEILLLLDRSASMDENDIAPDLTRWEGVVPLVNQAVTATDATVSWGLKTFPEAKDNECDASSVTSFIDVPIAPLNASKVVSQVNQTLPDGDGTPTGPALAAAVTYLSSRASDRQQFILLATDGQPSCSLAWEKSGDDAREDAITGAEQALQAGFPVFVIGVLDEDRSDSVVETLNEVATAGGKPRSGSAEKFFLASSQAELTSALSDITEEVASCVFPFQSAPPDPTNIAVKVNGALVTQDPARANGWEYTSDAQLGLELFGVACDTVKTGNQSSIDIIFGCPGVEIEIF